MSFIRYIKEQLDRSASWRNTLAIAAVVVLGGESLDYGLISRLWPPTGGGDGGGGVVVEPAPTLELPAGAIVAAYKAETPPDGWVPCGTAEETPSANGRILIGTTDSESVGNPSNPFRPGSTTKPAHVRALQVMFYCRAP